MFATIRTTFSQLQWTRLIVLIFLVIYLKISIYFLLTLFRTQLVYSKIILIRTSLLLAMNLLLVFIYSTLLFFYPKQKERKKKIQLLIRNQIIKDFVAALIQWFKIQFTIEVQLSYPYLRADYRLIENFLSMREICKWTIKQVCQSLFSRLYHYIIKPASVKN